jgi:hypothetical protein
MSSQEQEVRVLKVDFDRTPMVVLAVLNRKVTSADLDAVRKMSDVVSAEKDTRSEYDGRVLKLFIPKCDNHMAADLRHRIESALLRGA